MLFGSTDVALLLSILATNFFELVDYRRARFSWAEIRSLKSERQAWCMPIPNITWFEITKFAALGLQTASFFLYIRNFETATYYNETMGMSLALIFCQKLWSYALFQMRSYGLSLVMKLLCLGTAIVIDVLMFVNGGILAPCLLLGYLVWLSTAFSVNVFMWTNRHSLLRAASKRANM